MGGAEKALFRALKKKGNTPKYGLIFHSSFIGRAAAKNKGRISRFLANKCSIASRIDCFAEHATNIFGSKLKEQVEDRLKFFETGDIPKKNMDVMNEALETIKKEESEFKTKEKKKKKKKNNKDESAMEEEAKPEPEVTETAETPKSEKKKKKKKETVEETPAVPEEVPEPTSEKKKKKRKRNPMMMNNSDCTY